jgi:tetratricopeptide (TPR) repeat protein
MRRSTDHVHVHVHVHRLLTAIAAIALWGAVVASPSTALGAGQTPAPPARDAVAALVAEARALLDAGKPDAAIAKLSAEGASTRLGTGAERDPRVAELLGVAYYHANDPARAIETLTPEIGRLPRESLERREAVQVLGLSHYLAGHLAEAIPYLEEIQPLVPDDIKLAYALGTAYIQTRQPAKARDAFARTFRVPPGSVAAHLLTAQMMIRLELEEPAQTELKLALEKDPRVPEAHYLLGQIAIFRSRLDEGLTLMRQELAINPAHAMALYRIGEIYSLQQQWESAITSLQQSIWINPYYSGPYILLGKAYAKTNRPAAAEDMLRRATQMDPNNKSAHYLLAQILQQAGRVDEAKQEFAIAEKLQGDKR